MGIKYKVDENFFDEWSPKMAYVLGYWYADGSIYPSVRGSYINVTSIDRQTISKIKQWLKSQHTILEVKSDLVNRRTRFNLRIGNRSLYSALTKLGIYPNKSLTVRLPQVPDKFFSHFLRGYFDGDGCVYLYRTRGMTQKLIIRKLTVVFTSGSKGFLEDLLIGLRKYLDLKQIKVYNSHRSFQLRFATSDSLKILYFMYNKSPRQLCLKRKFSVFLKYLKLKGIDYGQVAKQ